MPSFDISGASVKQILNAGHWILDSKGISFLIYPESSIQYPTSLRIKQWGVCFANWLV